MRIALVDTARRRRHYSIALLRLGAWRRSVGDECRLYENELPAIGEADEIWLSTVFNFDMDRALELAREARRRADRVLIGEIRELTAARGIRAIDFNQGLDARILTESSADLIAELPLPFIRFAFDGMQEDGHYQRAVRMMAERGIREFRSFVLYNHTGTPSEFYYRLRESVNLQEEFAAAGIPARVKSYPMLHHPITAPDVARESLGYHWRRSDVEAVRLILRMSTAAAMYVSPTGLEEFVYWWGADEGEFLQLLRYPKLRLLLERRRGSQRMKRAKARERGVDATAEIG